MSSRNQKILKWCGVKKKKIFFLIFSFLCQHIDVYQTVQIVLLYSLTAYVMFIYKNTYSLGVLYLKDLYSAYL